MLANGSMMKWKDQELNSPKDKELNLRTLILEHFLRER